MSLPLAPATLPDDFAAALGRAVAGFGFLEEALKRAIYALSRDHLGDEPDERELDAWVTRMEQIAGDSLGTLIDAFSAACQRGAALPHARRKALTATLRTIRDQRNMLCHASWRPAEGGGWRPGFVSSRGAEPPDRMDTADLAAIDRDTRQVAHQVICIAHGTGHDSWSPDGEAGQREAERARAAARAARNAAQKRPVRAATARREEDAWDPLDADD